MELPKLEKNLSHQFKNKDLIKEALTHRSYLNENPGWKLSNNERLEFLGDAVLELAVTESLFNLFPSYQEGTLTSYRSALVNYVMMAKIAREAGLEGFILLSQGESRDNGRARDVILANAMEAVIGAIYLDSDYATTKKVIDDLVMRHLEEVIKTGIYRDAKSMLQEKAQADFKVTPVYKVLSEQGPDHAKVFAVGVYFGEKFIASGEGPSKQDAEIEAAKKALTTL